MLSSRTCITPVKNLRVSEIFYLSIKAWEEKSRKTSGTRVERSFCNNVTLTLLEGNLTRRFLTGVMHVQLDNTKQN